MPIPMSERRRFWREKTSGLKFYATARSTLRPEKVDIDLCGHHVSIPFENGVRTYAFATQKFRDRFVNKYRPHDAKPCGDPLS